MNLFWPRTTLTAIIICIVGWWLTAAIENDILGVYTVTGAVTYWYYMSVHCDTTGQHL